MKIRNSDKKQDSIALEAVPGLAVEQELLAGNGDVTGTLADKLDASGSMDEGPAPVDQLTQTVPVRRAPESEFFLDYIHLCKGVQYPGLFILIWKRALGTGQSDVVP